jgi:hypothetical protein
MDTSSRDREADVRAVVRMILSGLFTWTMPADWGVDYGYVPDGRTPRRSYSSAEEVLHEVGIPMPDEEDPEHDSWPSEPLRAYAEGLWKEAGERLRALGEEP